jgi:MoxR-like ATPase
MSVKTKITKLLESLGRGVYERDEELRLALLSSVAGESVFLLGPPGVAKSLVARKLKFAYKDAKVFEYLMSRFSTPDEIFGPVAISKLKEDDKYERVTDRYLPSADVVFLDEIWKAGPSIQNALLTVINEKVYRNGEKEIKVPMKALVSASNELPAPGQGLEALWDRFLVRLVVTGIDGKENFNKMVTEKLNAYEDTVDEGLKITRDEYRSWDKAIDRVDVPENVLAVIDRLRRYIAVYNMKAENAKCQIYVSDRRWRKIVRLLRASAFLDDRKEVGLTDCRLISHCLWDNESQIAVVAGFVEDAVANRKRADKFSSDDESAPYNTNGGNAKSPPSSQSSFWDDIGLSTTEDKIQTALGAGATFIALGGAVALTKAVVNQFTKGKGKGKGKTKTVQDDAADGVTSEDRAPGTASADNADGAASSDNIADAASSVNTDDAVSSNNINNAIQNDNLEEAA